MIDFYPPAFHNVPYGTLQESACSPQVEDDANYRGFLIRLPERITFVKDEKFALPICGYYQLETGLILEKKMRINIQSVTHPEEKPQSLEIFPQPERDEIVARPPKREPIDPSLYKGQISESYFYLRGEYYVQTPLEAGDYDISMSYGPIDSNTVRVKIAHE